MCQSDVQGSITSGGGFSEFYPQPAFQAAHVAGYLQKAALAGQSPVAGFNAAGRGYPDISLSGSSYLTVIGGNIWSLSGTSASTPAVAGFFSNINAARLAAGKGSVGWVNPTLYANYTSFAIDITSGNNLCVHGGTCCTQGFYAAAGWDPITGLGSLNYGMLQNVLVSLGNINGALRAPTATPTTAPTSKPSNSPTPSPTRLPTQSPTFKPTFNPTQIPTRTPTLSPSFKPSFAPTFGPTVTPTFSPTPKPTTARRIVRPPHPPIFRACHPHPHPPLILR